MNVALAERSFFVSFRNIFPKLKVIESVKDLNETDLLIFSGGEDVNPQMYGEKNTHSSYNILRDRIERDIFYQAQRKNIKILGICRGHQLINVCLGGTLFQDIRAYLNIGHEAQHGLDFKGDDSFIKKAFEFKKVNSMHHQCVNIVGDGLIVTSSYKGIPESLEGKNIITTQFHPEFMEKDNTYRFWELIEKWVKGHEKQETNFAKKLDEKKLPSMFSHPIRTRVEFFSPDIEFFVSNSEEDSEEDF